MAAARTPDSRATHPSDTRRSPRHQCHTCASQLLTCAWCLAACCAWSRPRRRGVPAWSGCAGSPSSFRMAPRRRTEEMAFTNTSVRPGCLARMQYRYSSRSLSPHSMYASSTCTPSKLGDEGCAGRGRYLGGSSSATAAGVAVLLSQSCPPHSQLWGGSCIWEFWESTGPCQGVQPRGGRAPRKKGQAATKERNSWKGPALLRRAERRKVLGAGGDAGGDGVCVRSRCASV